MPGDVEGGQQPLPRRPPAQRPLAEQRGPLPVFRLRARRPECGRPEPGRSGRPRHRQRAGARDGRGPRGTDPRGLARGLQGRAERRRHLQRAVQSARGLQDYDAYQR